MRISRRSPTIAGVAKTGSCIELLVATLKSGPVFTTKTVPSSLLK